MFLSNKVISELHWKMLLKATVCPQSGMLGLIYKAYFFIRKTGIDNEQINNKCRGKTMKTMLLKSECKLDVSG
jgi:hypothetical protein